MAAFDDATYDEAAGPADPRASTQLEERSTNSPVWAELQELSDIEFIELRDRLNWRKQRCPR